ncbi:hypothetical protein JI667_18990 [Bacillus sp. NTK074B]|uniref:hypothetical protein n=1 Tax=Bacillus sp. NTK074B TaxID=2802174 RepID=UPI001A8F9D2A|nr:hypothetical protein [Bacillus sp. NTK074B]
MKLTDVKHQKTTPKYENPTGPSNSFGSGATIGLQTMDSSRNDTYCCCCTYACGGAVNKAK